MLDVNTWLSSLHSWMDEEIDNFVKLGSGWRVQCIDTYTLNFPSFLTTVDAVIYTFRNVCVPKRRGGFVSLNLAWKMVFVFATRSYLHWRTKIQID